ncbi:transposase [Granulicella tundricola MP5ACTX9]|uniref:Transposase n=1 Tax=Granulicella tundricola (strain ATCC BAA-1859 / DSM 23138 / MP5ACTX9) TaxID=1198114 RepID=E8X3Q8_GRATM|nr:transposase [Granulicella tundricola MP5ACTX9]
MLLGQLSERVGSSIPFACQDWASTKAAYRFLSNKRVSEEKILAGHFTCTRERFKATSDTTVLVLHDTTEFIYRREESAAIGIVSKLPTRYGSRPRYHTTCGVLMHSSLVVTEHGLPLGLTAIKFWTRDKFHGANALKRRINPTRVPIEQKESYRWLENLRQSTALLQHPERIVHIGDRESDIYELFCIAQEMGTRFLLRTCVDRLAGEGGQTVSDAMEAAPIKGLHRIKVRNRKGETSEAVLELRYRRIRLHPPIGKRKLYPDLDVTVLHATESHPPKDRDRIDWKLITNLPVHSRKDAVEKLRWYAMRWKIETFHKILKSGFKAEEVRLRAAERLVNLIAILCILSWRIFWMTMMNRTTTTAQPDTVFTTTELYLLDQLVRDKPGKSPSESTLTLYMTKLAQLGGYLARAKDPPPGNTVIWRGLSRLTDIQLGFLLRTQLVGN